LNERDLFVAALAIQDPAARACFLDQACAGAAGLRRRLETLLQHHGQAGGVLELPAAETGTRPYVPAAAAEEVGTFIGPYKLLQKLGEGGMGTVYLAEQTEPVRRRVALKIIKAGLDSRQVLARFEQERQALALMDHPHIAKILDGGSTADGRPYFVMELVKGIPITKYCDQEQLTPRERLALFIPVCQAVQHAHQKGIIHRDLKPSNVLIGLYDSKPIPKVIDFGVAKATGPQLTDQSLFTEVGRIIGTLEYMAPEQAELNNLDIDTRADIYSLGVLLYELLTGSPPFTGKQLRRAAFDDMLRMIREVEPPRPSTKLSSSEELSMIAARRKLEPKKLTRAVQGDLDWIVMKCLEKERSRRYETANGLALDLQRYLADEPVLARPPSTAYRLRKFLRRNKGPVLAAAVVLVALLAGMVGTTAGLFRANEAEAEARRQADDAEQARLDEARQRARAEQAAAGEKAQRLLAEGARHDEQRQREKAEQAAAAEAGAKAVADERRRQAEAAVAVLESLFQGLDPRAERLGGPDFKGRLLARLDAAAQLAHEALDALTQARLEYSLGQMYHGLGEMPKAVAQLQSALDRRQARLGPDDLLTLATANALAMAWQDAGQIEPALRRYEELLQKLEARFGPNHPQTLAALNNVASASLSAGKLQAALALLERVVQARKAVNGPDSEEVLQAMGNLALAYLETGQFNKALPLCEAMVKQSTARFGPDHPDTLRSLNSLALAYHGLGQLDLAQPLLEETLTRAQGRLGPDHPQTLAAIANLAIIRLARGKVDLAVAALEQALARLEIRLGPDHPETLRVRGNLAEAWRVAGKLVPAQKLWEKNLDLARTRLGPDHPVTLTLMNNLAVAYRETNQFDRAADLFRQALEKRTAQFGPDHPDTLIPVSNLAQTYRDAGKLDLALPLFQQAYAGRKAALGANHALTLFSLHGLAVVHGLRGRLDLALPLLEELVERRKGVLGPKHTDTLGAMRDLAGACDALGHFAKAEPLHRELLEEARRAFGADDVGTADPLSQLGQNLVAQGKFADAEPLLARWVELQRPKLAANDTKLAFHLSLLGECRLLWQQYAEAETTLRDSLAIYQKGKLESFLRFHTMSLLGAALAGQKKYADAEPLLVNAARVLKGNAPKLAAPFLAKVVPAVRRVIELYEAWDRPEEAARWRAELEALEKARPAPKGGQVP
jgi:serine/threonine protein kinase